MDREQLEQYRVGLTAHRTRQRNDCEARRLRVLARAREAISGLLGLGAHRALLFGSILSAKRFHERSDVDILVYGLPVAKYSAALRLLEGWPGLEEVEIDLKLAEEQPVDFVSFVEQQGG